MDADGTRPGAIDASNARLRTTGPVSRTYRLLAAAMMGWFVIEWATWGIDGYSQPSTLRNPWNWAVGGLAVYYGLYHAARTVFGRRWCARVVATFAGLLVAAATLAVVTTGVLWAAPVTWLLYGLEGWFLALATVALAASAVLGTPGCDILALEELVRRVRGFPPADDAKRIWCVGGLNALDQWERESRLRLPRDGHSGGRGERRVP